MAFRRRMSHGHSKRNFSRHGSRTHVKNMRPLSRGGIRL